MTRRTLILILLILITVFVLSGCGEEEMTPSDEATTEQSPTATPTPTPTPSPSPSPSPSPTKEVAAGLQKYDGYLLDARCGKDGKDTHGNDLTTEEGLKKHTTACLKTRASTGYGMMIYRSGKWTFFKFDEAGNKMVKRYIVDKTKKTNQIKITVRGVIDGSTIQLGVKGGTVLGNYGLS